MCISPDRMTEQELRNEIQWLLESLDNPNLAGYHYYYKSRAGKMQQVLQERFPQPKGLDIGEEKRHIIVVPVEQPTAPAVAPVLDPEPAPVEVPDRELIPA